MLSPLLSINFFHTRSFLKHKRVRPQVFWYCETKESRKSWYPFYPFFWNQNNSETQKCSPTIFFGDVSQRISDGKRDNPHPFLSILFSIPDIFWNTEGFPYEVFRSCDTKNFRQNHYALQISNAPPPSPLLGMEYSDSRFFFEIQKGSPMNFFGTVRQKNSTENSDIPFLCIKFFDTRNFLKHWSVLQWNFSVVRLKNFERSLLHKIQKSVVELMFLEN